MSYQHDHLAWQQRCAQEINRRSKFEVDYQTGKIEPITQSSYDINLLNSSYTHGFANLLTLDQKRYLEYEKDIQNKGLRVPLKTNGNPYKIQKDSRGNYSFGGQTPIRTRIQSAQGVQRATQSSMGQFTMDRKNSVYDPSIYDVVKQNIKLPDGLLYRGKYSGQAKERPQMNPQDDERYRGNNRRPGSTFNSTRLPLKQMRTNQTGRKNTSSRAANQIQKITSVTPIRNHETLKSRNEQVQGTTKNLTSPPIKQRKQIQKYYPEDYFRRSGYDHQPYGKSSEVALSEKGFVEQLKQQQEIDFERFNEQLSYPAQGKANKKLQFGERQLKQEDIDKFSRVSKSSKGSWTPSLKSKSVLQKNIQKMKERRQGQLAQGQSQKTFNSIRTAEIIKLINGVNDASEKASKVKITEEQRQLTQEELLRSLDKEQIMEGLQLTWDEENGCYVDEEGNLVSMDLLVEQLRAQGHLNLDMTLQDQDIDAVNSTVVHDIEGQNNTLPEPAYSQVSRAKSAMSRGGNRQNRKLKSKTLKKKVVERDLESQVTQVTGASSLYSKISGKSYISKLEVNLNEEKKARKQLQKEIQEIKKLYSQTTEKLGILK